MTTTMAEILRPQILIVGAGPVGVPLAIGLKRRGHDVLLVERTPQIGRPFKGEFLQPTANQLLSDLGLNEVFEKPSSSRITELRFRDLNESGGVNADLCMPYPKKAFALSVSHHDLLAGLWQHARSELGENFWTGITLKAENENSPRFLTEPVFQATHKTLGDVRVAPKWVIGCDGRASSVRSWMAGPRAPRNSAVTWFAGEEFIVGAEIHQGGPLEHRYEVIRSYEKGTLSLFSLGKNAQRLYYSATGMDGNLNIDRRREVSSLLEGTRAFGNFGEISQKIPLVAFPSYTADFGEPTKGRFLLAGDACNVTTPFGGQGITAGFEHAKFLLEEFDFGAGTRTSALDKSRYTEKVDEIFTRISLLNFGLYYLFFARAPMFKATSEYVINIWEQNPELKERVVRLFAGLDTDQPRIMELLELWGLHPKAGGSRFVSKRVTDLIIKKSEFLLERAGRF